MLKNTQKKPAKSMKVIGPGKRKRRPQERAEITKEKLLQSALAEFSEKGFDGVTARDIETRADVQRGLLSYHFNDRETIWRASVDYIFGELTEFRRTRNELARDLSIREQLIYRIRSFIRFSAQHPELNRLMIQEGKCASWRSIYIIDEHLRQNVLGLQELAGSYLEISERAFAHWYYIYIGAGALAFSLAPEATYLFNIDIHDDEFIEEHASMMIDALLSCAPAKQPES